MILRSFFDQSSIPERRMNGEWTENERRMNGGWTELERRLNGGWTEDERRMNGGWTEDERRMNENRSKTDRELERRTIRKIYRRNCWADCEVVSLLMIFQKLIKVDFGTFLLDDNLYNTLQSIRHIKTLLPNAEHCQTYCLKIISLQPHENQEESNAEKKIKLNS